MPVSPQQQVAEPVVKTAASAVLVLSGSAKSGERIKSLVDSVCAGPCTVVTSAKSLRQNSVDRRIELILIDRAANDQDLEDLADLGNHRRIATFGISNSASVPLAKIEASACYRLRHPVICKDLEMLLGRCDAESDAKTPRRPLGRSSHLYRGLVGDSAGISRLRDLIQKIAPSVSTVLISGETGTGKEIVARNIHYYSRRGTGPFVPVNCSAIPPDLLESELFGHKKGAFTGALSDRDGRFATAAGGTLFLDEIGDMSPALQVKLLRVLEERIIYRVGCNKPITMTGRLIAATHRNLEDCIEKGSFREDLYYRLNVVPISVPPLRDRKEDIQQLVKELGCRLQREQGITVDLTPTAISSLRKYDWPGNVRELANLIERLAVVCPDGLADVADLPDKYVAVADGESLNSDSAPAWLNHKLTANNLPADGIDLKCFLRSAEADLIRQALRHSGGTMTNAANLLHVGRTTLSEKVKRLGLSEFVKAASQS